MGVEDPGRTCPDERSIFGSVGIICSCLTFCFFCVKTKERVVVLAQHFCSVFSIQSNYQSKSVQYPGALGMSVLLISKIKQHRHKQPMLSDTKSFSFFSQKPCVLSCRFRYETYRHTRHHQIAAAYFLRGPLLPHRHASHTPERACYTRCPPLKKCDHRPLVKRHTTTVTYTTLYVKKSVGLLL